jgi:hypothetical protein
MSTLWLGPRVAVLDYRLDPTKPNLVSDYNQGFAAVIDQGDVRRYRLLKVYRMRGPEVSALLLEALFLPLVALLGWRPNPHADASVGGPTTVLWESQPIGDGPADVLVTNIGTGARARASLGACELARACQEFVMTLGAGTYLVERLDRHTPLERAGVPEAVSDQIVIHFDGTDPSPR